MEINGGFVPSLIECKAMVDAQAILSRAQLLMGPARSEMEISLHGPMSRAWEYLESLRTGMPNRFIDCDGHKFSTIKAFFELEDTDVEDKFCVTGNHSLDTHGSALCQCTILNECGCAIDLDETSVCEHCDRCEACCDAHEGCFTCHECSNRMGVFEACGVESCSSCQGCCEDHYTCRHCENRTTNSCSNCECCDSCCNCSFCDVCERSFRSDDFCGDCSNCENCCMCNDEDDGCGDRRKRFVEFSSYGLAFIDAGRKEFKINPLRRHISCEIEVDHAELPNNNQGLRAALAKWKDSVVKDGSLHGAQAHEVNTQPTNGDAFLNHIQEICDGYKAVEASASGDCGLHVHVDTRDFAFYDVRRLILTYTKVEQALFELCNALRLNQHYSQICGQNYTNMSADPQLFKRQILGSFYQYGSLEGQKLLPKRGGNRHVFSQKREKYVDIRYRALNVHSHFYRKSIEFRHHEGTVDAKEIINWSLTVANVVQSSHVLSEAKINNLSNNPRKALRQITPVNLHEYFYTKWISWDACYSGRWEEITTGMFASPLPTEEPAPVHRSKKSMSGKKRCKVNNCQDCVEEEIYRNRVLARRSTRSMYTMDTPVVANIDDPLSGCDCLECNRMRDREIATENLATPDRF